MVKVATRTAKWMDRGRTHFPIVEGVIDGANTQSHIHNCDVRLILGHQIHVFRVFFKRHVHLPANNTISFMAPQFPSIVRGDIVVMCVAADGEGVVNFRGNDSLLVDIMMPL